MLRSIFSLIQNIIDSDREYNNKKSTTVYCLNSENHYNVDLEINGKPRESLTMIRKHQEASDASNSLNVTTDQVSQICTI